MHLDIWVVANDLAAATALSAGLASLGTVTALDLEAFATYQMPIGATILFDVDLEAPRTISVLRTGLKRASGPQAVIAVDARNRRHKVQADALGAAAVIVRPLDRARLLKTLEGVLARTPRPRADASPTPLGAARERSVPAPRLDPRDAAQSVGLAGAVLNRLFDGLMSGRPVDPATVTAAATAVQDSIDRVGLDVWLSAVREQHAGTYQHSLLVTGVASVFAHHLGLDKADRKQIAVAGLLHDIGKVKIPLQILDKPGVLSPAEFHIMKKHPSIGAAYLEAGGGFDPVVIDMVLHHHELLDGSGYPDGLRGDAIDRRTHILTVADIFSALVEERNYKLPMRADLAYRHLVSMATEHKLDPDLVKDFAPVAGEVTVRPLRA